MYYGKYYLENESMKKALIFLILLPFGLMAQNQKEIKAEIEKNFNQIRSAKTAKPITEDTILSARVNKLYGKGVFNKEMDKDEIRENLREQYIYDYNFEIISIPLKKTKSNELKLSDRKLTQILKDSTYNIYGIIYNKNARQDSINILFIQRNVKIA